MSFFYKTKRYVSGLKAKSEARTEKKYKSMKAKTKVLTERNKIRSANEKAKSEMSRIKQASLERRFGGLKKVAKEFKSTRKRSTTSKKRSTKKRSTKKSSSNSGARRIIRKVRTKKVSSSPFAPEKWN